MNSPSKSASEVELLALALALALLALALLALALLALDELSELELDAADDALLAEDDEPPEHAANANAAHSAIMQANTTVNFLCFIRYVPSFIRRNDLALRPREPAGTFLAACRAL